MTEIEYGKRKLKENYDFYDINVRNSFVKSKVTTLMIKCAYGVNPYGVQNNMINKKVCGNKCIRCSEVETWEHVVKCEEIKIKMCSYFCTEWAYLDLTS